MARPVAKFTVAETPSMALRFLSTRAAHAAQVIPVTGNPTSPDTEDAAPVTAADDT